MYATNLGVLIVMPYCSYTFVLMKNPAMEMNTFTPSRKPSTIKMYFFLSGSSFRIECGLQTDWHGEVGRTVQSACCVDKLLRRHTTCLWAIDTLGGSGASARNERVNRICD
jgi:hypothetical protein